MYVYLLFFSPLSHELWDCLIPRHVWTETSIFLRRIIQRHFWGRQKLSRRTLNKKKNRIQAKNEKANFKKLLSVLITYLSQTEGRGPIHMLLLNSWRLGQTQQVVFTHRGVWWQQFAHRRTVEASRPKRISSSYFLFPSFICMKPHWSVKVKRRNDSGMVTQDVLK